MNYASIKYNDIANGDGVRTSLFVSGCSHHCKGCFNSVAWDYDYGEEFNTSVMADIINSLKSEFISGLSILGGEPLDPKNMEQVMDIVVTTKILYPEKPIWVYTGYTFEDINSSNYYIYKTILDNIDVLVDGKFDEELKDISLRFRGSSNQRIIDVQKSLKQNKTILYIE